MKTITCCRVCESPNIRPFFDLGNQPLANSLPQAASECEQTYPLSLSWCQKCSLVQLNETVEPSILFSEYVWVTGTSKGANDFSEIFYDNFINRTAYPRDGYILELASNDGTFLKPFSRDNYDILGIDPARNICAMAVANNIPTQCSFWSSATARELVAVRGQARGIFARNVLAHVANLNDFVAGIAECICDDGTLAIEVHYADAILKGLQYDSIYHEHLCYFTLKSVEALLQKHGFAAFDVLDSPISGGAIIVYARKGVIKPSENLLRWRHAEMRDRTNERSTWEAFAVRAFQHRNELRELLHRLKERGESIVGWGASARCSTLLNFCGISSELLPAIVDQNPMKQGRVTAGTHIPIHSAPDVMNEKPSNVFITGWNFADEITDCLKYTYHFAGSVIIPFPNTPLVKSL